jgi:hypothetical protein
MLDEREKLAAMKRYAVGMAILLVIAWILYDFLLVGSKDFRKAQEYSFEGKTIREISGSLNDEFQHLYSGVDEKEQIMGFVHLLERNHYLLYRREIRLESFYDFISGILYPKQKVSLRDKSRYTFGVRRYLRRMRKTQYEYLKYELSEPEFYYEDYTRNARVLSVRTTVEGSKEYHKYYFREYKDRYYLYLK